MKAPRSSYDHEAFSSVAHYKDRIGEPINHLSHLNQNGKKTPPVDVRTLDLSQPKEDSGLFENCRYCSKAKRIPKASRGFHWKCLLGYSASALTQRDTVSECLDFKQSQLRPKPKQEEVLHGL